MSKTKSGLGLISEFDDNLKPCPFCGAEAHIMHVEFNDQDIWYTPQCFKCPCGWQYNYKTIEEAIEAWNTREL